MLYSHSPHPSKKKITKKTFLRICNSKKHLISFNSCVSNFNLSNSHNGDCAVDTFTVELIQRLKSVEFLILLLTYFKKTDEINSYLKIDRRNENLK